MGTNSLGRVYGKYTHSVGDGYGYSKLSINFPEIMAVAALVIYAPGVLGAIETIGAVEFLLNEDYLRHFYFVHL